MLLTVRSLSEPLIPPTYFSDLASLVEEEDNVTKVAKLKKIVQGFPLENRCTLGFLLEVCGLRAQHLLLASTQSI
jgi:hypothetical protein